MNKEKNKKVLFVDLLRILACIIVVVCHCRFYLPGNNNTKSRILLACFTADGVSIFWMIMGMFYFRNIEYKVRIKKMFKRIVLPIIIMSIIIFYFNDFLLGNTSILNSVNHSFNDYILLIKDNIITWTPINYLGHLWYLYIYILLVLLYPILNKIREYIDIYDYKKVLLFFILILIINDLSLNRLMQFSLHGLNALFASLIYFYSGYLLYKNNDKLTDKKVIKYIILFTVVNVIRALCAYFVLKNQPDCRELLKWYTSFGLIVCICLYMLTRNIMNKIKIKNIHTKILQHFSKLTLYIYLVHCNVIYIVDSRDINKYLLNKFDNHIIYLLVYTLIVLVVSFIISELIILIIYLINKIKKLNIINIE